MTCPHALLLSCRLRIANADSGYGLLTYNWIDCIDSRCIYTCGRSAVLGPTQTGHNAT